MYQKLIYRLAALAVLLALVVVVLGAFTRLVDAGLGCPDWPGCYGHLTWPSSHEEVARAEMRFPESPVEHDKTWPEMVHRYAASLLGLLIIAILWVSIRGRRHGSSTPVKLPAFLLGLVILQGAFGMWTVTLKLWPQVVTAHLLGGFATLGLLWLLAQRTGGFRWALAEANNAQAVRRSLPKLRFWALLVMVLVVLQVALGGWTSSNYAAVACPDLPTCHGLWWPQVDFVAGFNIFQHVGPNYLGGLLDNHARTAIHLSHRLGAIVVLVGVLVLAVYLWQSRWVAARKWALILCAVLIVQLVLGISNVYWVLPLHVAVAHNAVAAGLLLVLVTINHRLRTAAD